MRSVELLIKASNVLAYEWDMLRDCRAWLVAHERCRGSTLYKALVEATLLHARQLIEFFYKPYDENKFPNDIRLLYWFPVGSCDFRHFRCHSSAGTLRDERSRIHILLAHLTQDRIGEHVYWNESTVIQLDLLMADFANRAGDQVGDKLRDVARKPRLVATGLSMSTAAISPAVEDGTLGKPTTS